MSTHLAQCFDILRLLLLGFFLFFVWLLYIDECKCSFCFCPPNRVTVFMCVFVCAHVLIGECMRWCMFVCHYTDSRSRKYVYEHVRSELYMLYWGPVCCLFHFDWFSFRFITIHSILPFLALSLSFLLIHIIGSLNVFCVCFWSLFTFIHTLVLSHLCSYSAAIQMAQLK